MVCQNSLLFLLNKDTKNTISFTLFQADRRGQKRPQLGFCVFSLKNPFKVVTNTISTIFIANIQNKNPKFVILCILKAIFRFEVYVEMVMGKDW